MAGGLKFCWTGTFRPAPATYGDCMETRVALPLFSLCFFPEQWLSVRLVRGRTKVRGCFSGRDELSGRRFSGFWACGMAGRVAPLFRFWMLRFVFMEKRDTHLFAA
jgi:hypothetical protein